MNTLERKALIEIKHHIIDILKATDNDDVPLVASGINRINGLAESAKNVIEAIEENDYRK